MFEIIVFHKCFKIHLIFFDNFLSQQHMTNFQHSKTEQVKNYVGTPQRMYHWFSLTASGHHFAELKRHEERPSAICIFNLRKKYSTAK